MIRTYLVLMAGIVFLATASPALAQFTPPAPAAPAVPGAAAPAAPATPAPQTLWNWLGITPQNCQKCRDKCCASPLGQLLNAMTKPLSFASGGLVPPLCPPVSPTDLANANDPNNPDAGGAEAVAAKIKADEAKAKARRAAVRYLGTVDCARFPEAEGALIKALREDTNECVRWEAALALGKGCCCTKKTVAALTLSATGKDTDKNPVETSERVRAAALHALNLCAATIAEEPEEPTPPEQPPSKTPPTPPEQPPITQLQQAFPGGVKLTAYYTAYLPRVPRRQIMEAAARVLAERVGTEPVVRRTPSGQRGLLQLWNNASTVSASAEAGAYDEAALTMPPRPQPKAAPSGGGARVGLSFQAAQAQKPNPVRLILLEQQPKVMPVPQGQAAAPVTKVAPTPVPSPNVQGMKQVQNAAPEPVPFPNFAAPRPVGKLSAPTAPPDFAAPPTQSPGATASLLPPTQQLTAADLLPRGPYPVPSPEAEARLPHSRTEQPALQNFATTLPAASFSSSAGMIRTGATVSP
jgi:hypothetical protein